jgi:prefoldin subunit 5
MTQKTSVLRIGHSKTALNKRQKEFNRLTEKIEQLDALIPELNQAYDQILERIPNDLNPLVLEYQTYRVEMVHIMDRTYSADLYRKIYQTKLAYLITETAFDLIVNHGFENLKPLYEKYSDVDFDTALAEYQEQHVKPEEDLIMIEESAESLIDFHELDEEEQFRIKEEQRLQRAREQGKLDVERQKTTRSVRKVYMDLVKAFHPDRESDEVEKIRKTDIMQQVTAAYQQNNLMELLKLQIDFERVDHDHLENLGKDQLNYYNKVLQQQIEDLEAEKEQIQHKISAVTGLIPKHINSLTTAIVKFNTNINEVKAEIKEIKNTLKIWVVPSRLKAFLKTYEIPTITEFEGDYDD